MSINLPKYIKYSFQKEDVELIKSSITDEKKIIVHYFDSERPVNTPNSKYNKLSNKSSNIPLEETHEGLNYYKEVAWVIRENIESVRPKKVNVEIFAGFDSEYTTERIFKENSEDNKFHADISRRHVGQGQDDEGSRIFHELGSKERTRILKANIARNAGFKNTTLSYQFSTFSPQLGIMENKVLLVRKNDKPSFKGVMVQYIRSLGLAINEDITHKPKSFAYSLVSRNDTFTGISQNTPRGQIQNDQGIEGSDEFTHKIIRLYLVCHFTLGELQTFSDFQEIKNKFDNLRSTFVSMRGGFELNTTFGTRKIDIEIVLRDTLLLAPAGFQSLSQLAKRVGMPKLELPAGHTKDRMDLLLYKDTDLAVNIPSSKSSKLSK